MVGEAWDAERSGRVEVRVGSSFPVNKKSIASGLADTPAEGDRVARIEPLLLHKTAPAFSHDVALAGVPIGVAESPWLAVAIFEVEEKTFVVGRRV